MTFLWWLQMVDTGEVFVGGTGRPRLGIRWSLTTQSHTSRVGTPPWSFTHDSNTPVCVDEETLVRQGFLFCKIQTLPFPSGLLRTLWKHSIKVINPVIQNWRQIVRLIKRIVYQRIDMVTVIKDLCERIRKVILIRLFKGLKIQDDGNTNF